MDGKPAQCGPQADDRPAKTQLEPSDIHVLAPVGHYIGLRMGGFFPQEQINHFPKPWVEHYTANGLMPYDPVIRWVFGNCGIVRWCDLLHDDPRGVFRQARAFGLLFGFSVSYCDSRLQKFRSFGSFVRADREFNEVEMRLLQAYVHRLHHERMPPQNLTAAEIEVLVMVKQGQRLKEMAHVLGVSEGAVKQRLRNARRKLGAKTASEAAVLAASYNLI